MTGRPARLGVGVVGAGRVGAVLASVLRQAGHAVVGASGVSRQTQERIEELLPGVPRLAVEQVVDRAELVLLTVPDDVLAPLVAGLAQLGHFRAGQLLVHTCGRYGVQVLEPARAAGAIPLAIHPAMTFSGTALDQARLSGAPFAVTADPEVLPIAQALVVELGGEPVVVAEPDRGRYHAALSHAANHLVTLIAQARSVLAAAHLDDPGPVLWPLAQAALDGSLRGGDAALTGPVARADAGTLAEHVTQLSGSGIEPDVLDSYRALALATAERARRSGRLRPEQHREVSQALTGPAIQPDLATARGDTSVLVVAHDICELQAALSSRRRAVVMTMGALHAGHLELVRRAAEVAEEVVVTIFVNPLQFGADEDLDRYPRTLAADLDQLQDLGVVDIVFAPTVAQMYPHGEPSIRVTAGAMGQLWEGAARPGHFDGMLTVVAKLLHLTRPDIAVFGHKDAQQLALIRGMVADLDMGVDILAVPTVREDDGLAMSSRNVHLSAAERLQALVLARALTAGQAASPGGPGAVLAAAQAELDCAGPLVKLDYVQLVDPETLLPAPPESDRATLLLVAAQVGATRLIDNAVIDYSRD